MNSHRAIVTLIGLAIFVSSGPLQSSEKIGAANRRSLRGGPTPRPDTRRSAPPMPVRPPPAPEEPAPPPPAPAQPASPLVPSCQFQWRLLSFDPWTACTVDQRTRTEQWTRNLSSSSACGPLIESRVSVQACTPPPAVPPPAPSPYAALLELNDLIYEGAFRVPPASGGSQPYEYGGTALAYHPAHDSLLLVGHDQSQHVGEISIPAPTITPYLALLPRATAIQSPADVLDGKRMTIDGDISNGVKIGGIMPVGNSFVVTAWSYYDTSPQKQTKTHFLTGQSVSAPGPVTGPFQVGNGFQDYVPTDTSRIGGFVSGYMSTIPAAWQPMLGGTHLTGQGGGVSILSRTSSGPSATVFNAGETGVPNSPTKLVMGYPSDPQSPLSLLEQPTVGVWGAEEGVYNGMQNFRGMVFPEGTRSILFFGSGATTFCYGAATDNLALHLAPVPGQIGQHYCYDPIGEGIGPHGFPYTSIVWAYDANDFVAVKQGNKDPWEVVPYAIWNLVLPFQKKIVNGVDVGFRDIVGAAYDPASKRIFLSAYRQDALTPLIHVFRVP